MTLALGALKQPDLDRDEIRAAILASPFAEFADRLLGQLRRSIRVSVRDSEVSGSRLGGMPFAPRHFEWPHWDARPHFEKDLRDCLRAQKDYGTPIWEQRAQALQAVLAGDTRRPLAFLAQFDLAELPRCEDMSALPERGVLYFFADLVNCPPGFYPSSRGSWQAIWIEHPGELVEAMLPDYSGQAWWEEFRWWPSEVPRSRSVNCELRWTLPTEAPMDCRPEQDEDEDGDDAFDVEEAYGQLLHDLGQRHPVDDHDGEHRLLGHALPVQNPMEHMCECASNGVDVTVLGYEHPKVKQLTAAAAGWILLLQLDSDKLIPWMFGDGGMVYFWIKKQDLDRRNFDAVWGEMQCS